LDGAFFDGGGAAGEDGLLGVGKGEGMARRVVGFMLVLFGSGEGVGKMVRNG
jgi:hypothetical protein